MNYFVTVLGHLAWFEQIESAREFAKDFGGTVYNYWGFASIEPDTSDIPEAGEDWFRNAVVKRYRPNINTGKKT